ncbi:MAG: discoidin domain-containing protein, partial [bacterium]|nr:discoidin domain-containing protein [bacterium]
IGWKLWRDKQPFLKPLVIFSVCALLMIAPWVAKNWVWLGNPVSPFFNSVFPNPHIHVAFEKGYAEHLRHYDLEGLKSHWDIPLELTVRGAVLRGHLGPLFLLSPLALLALGRRQGRKLLLAALVFASVYITNIGTRFLVPALPFFSLALAMVFTRIPPAAYALVLLHGLVSWPDIAKLHTEPYAFHLDRIEWKAALRLESEDGWLRSKFPGYVIARMVETHVPPGERVLTFSQVAEAYTDRESIVVYQSAHGELLGDILWTPLYSDYQATRHIRFDFPRGEYRKLRVVETASHHFTNWSVTEMRFYADGAEVPRAPDWRLRAHPNPWDVQLAFDNSQVTRWRTWEAIRDGMYIEADFGQARSIDSVLLESSGDQWDIRLRLEGMDAFGNWATISEEPTETPHTPYRALRREASRELKYRGVRYLLVHGSDLYKDDYPAHLQEWGITEIAKAGDVRLYRID